MPKTTKPKSSVAKAKPSKATDPKRNALNALIARHGTPSADWRAAFDELMTDEGRLALGGKTRSENVFGEGVAWGVALDADFKTFPAKLKEHYSEERYRYFLASLVALDDARQAQKASQGAKSATATTTDDREAAARAARQTLISKLKGYAGGRQAERDALSVASGTTENFTALGESINRLVELGQSWLDRPAKTSTLQAQSAGLTRAVLDAAAASGSALSGAATDSTLAGRGRAGDAPEVNIAEGTVLHEMAEALRCVNEAHAAYPKITKLVPGPGTRSVLAPAPAKKPTAAPVTPAVTPAPTKVP
jgi:hypothetical protein